MSEPAPPPPGFALHHVQLAIPAGSEDRCRAFYIGTLEMSEVAKPAALAGRGGLWLRSGRLEIHLGVDDDFHPATKAHPGILTDDLDAVAARLAAAGVLVTWDDLFPGHRRFYST
ncbi:MAG: glyoxalase, partial [Actinomycetota bacterium]|nr:glyoxalase [Actinomycetota bacterium]